MRNGPRRDATGHDAFQFQALSVGIGIGDLKAPTPAHQKASPSAPAQDKIAPVYNAPSFAPVAPQAPVRTEKNELAPPRGKGIAISYRILAYSLDFFFVALTLAIALALATVLSAVRTGETENWLATKPIQWLAGLDPYAIVGGVYAAFFAYALLFKLLAGNTVGEGLLGVSRKKFAKPVKA